MSVSCTRMAREESRIQVDIANTGDLIEVVQSRGVCLSSAGKVERAICGCPPKLSSEDLSENEFVMVDPMSGRNLIYKAGEPLPDRPDTRIVNIKYRFGFASGSDEYETLAGETLRTMGLAVAIASAKQNL